MADGLKITTSGDWSDTLDFLERAQKSDWVKKLHSLAAQGVSALAAATPRESGETAAAWSYTIRIGSSYVFVDWHNANEVNGFSVAVGLQYGHGTGTGGYVRGTDYINPAIQPIIDQMVEVVWKDITR
jgi:hypothetical protein